MLLAQFAAVGVPDWPALLAMFAVAVVLYVASIWAYIALVHRWRVLAWIGLILGIYVFVKAAWLLAWDRSLLFEAIMLSFLFVPLIACSWRRLRKNPQPISKI